MVHEATRSDWRARWRRLEGAALAVLLLLTPPLGFLAGGAGRLPRSILALELAPLLDVQAIWSAFSTAEARWSARWALGWDFAFLLVYAALLALLARQLVTEPRRRRACVVGAVLAALLDAVENGLLWGLLQPGLDVTSEAGAALLACGAAVLKLLLVAGVVGACAVELVRLLRGTPSAGAGLLPAVRATLRRVVDVADAARDALRPVWFHVLVVLGLGVALVGVAQAQDVIRSVGEVRSPVRGLVLLGTTLVWAWTAWFWARFLLTAKLNQEPDLTSRPVSQWLLTWTPRLLALAAFAGVAFGFWRASFDGPAVHEDAWRARVVAWGCVFLGAGLVTFLALAGRRTLAGRLQRNHPALARKLQMDADVTAVPSQREVARTRELFRGRTIRWAVALGAAALGIPVVAFAAAPVAAGNALDAAVTLALAGSAWIPVGSLLALFGRTAGVPVLRVLVLWALVITGLNDNHGLRLLPAPQTAPRRPTVDARLAEWLQHQHRHAPHEREHRLYLVAAEGGGIRAAAWTAAALGGLQAESRGAFGRQLFAVSSVSGGSLGATVFAAQLAQGTRPEDFPAGARAFFSEDLLSAGWGSLLFPDALQRLLPAPVLPDRAQALEAAWEAAWARTAGKGVEHPVDLSAPFLDLWRPERESWVPSLLLNATSVETGARLIVSDLDGDAGSPVDFPHALDGLDVVGAGLRLSSAAHLGARFPYISPAATLADRGGHAVDGGYYENRGAATLHDLLRALRRSLGAADGLGHPVRVVVVQLAYRVSEGDRAPAPLSDLLVPVQTLLNTPDGRGEHATQQLAAERDVEYLAVLLEQRGAPMPLGWRLSALARDAIFDQAEEVLGWDATHGAVCAVKDTPACGPVWRTPPLRQRLVEQRD